jgi:hypothetical protein
MSRSWWRGRAFHFTVAATVMGMMGVYLPPPPVIVQPDETTMEVDQLLESELDSWLEEVSPPDPEPRPENER